MDPSRSIAIVGAGPRGAMVLERLIANAGDAPLHVHLVDPFPAGPGRIWRLDQPANLWVNSTAADTTMFTDASVRIDGPIHPGPNLLEWAATVGVTLDDVDLAAEAATVQADTFPTRRLAAQYLHWFLDEVIANAPSNVEVTAHAALVTDVVELDADGTDHRQIVELDGGPEQLVVDAVVLTLGHVDTHALGGEAVVAEFAARHGITYLPPDYTADTDLDALRAGADVIVRGFGLGFVDLMLMLTECRGGRFHTDADGALRYDPSGEEPVLWVGSRRGVPYRAKPSYALQGARPDLPRFFNGDAVDVLLQQDRVDFRTDVWPLLAKEISWGYYHELITAHPERITVGLDEFLARFSACRFDSDEERALIDEVVPAAADRLDLDALDRPFAGQVFAGLEEWESAVRTHVADDIARRADPSFSADLGGFIALLSVFAQIPRIAASGKLDAASRIDEMDGWWFGFFSYYASGPPPHRLRQLLALAEAGVVRFLGPDMWIELDETAGRFRAGSAAHPFVLETDTMVEGRLPNPSVVGARHALLTRLHHRAQAVEEEVRAEDGSMRSTGLMRVDRGYHVVHADGSAHERRFAVGPHSTAKGPAFTRPRTNAAPFRQNDALARVLLTSIGLEPLAHEPTKEGVRDAR